VIHCRWEKTIKVIKLVMDTKFKAALSPTLKIILLEGKELGKKRYI
jgi:hypothetical protein